MRALSDYALRDWLVGAPLTQRLRRLRNVAVDRLYRGRRAPDQDAVVARLAQHRALAFTVAFNMPDAIDLLGAAMGRAMPGTVLAVCDNSSDPAARAAIGDLCRRRGLPYCALPPSPFKGGRNGSRSHAVALNWILHNLIRPAAPQVFALIDHDLVPLAPCDLPALVRDQPCYGMVRRGRDDGAWFLWPGYSVFDFEAVRRLPLDFGTDTPLTLDTGGQNWGVLYSGLDLSRIRQATQDKVILADPQTGEREPFLLTDGWLHVGGAGHRGGGPGALARVRAAYDRMGPQALLATLRATIGT